MEMHVIGEIVGGNEMRSLENLPLSVKMSIAEQRSGDGGKVSLSTSSAKTSSSVSAIVQV